MGDLQIYRASAGAGKTYTLVKLFIANALRDTHAFPGEPPIPFSPYAFSHTLCVTFTQKATAEMKERIISKLYDLAYSRDPQLEGELSEDTGLPIDALRKRAQETLRTLLQHYSLLSVSTIDSFIQQMVSTLVWELQLGTDFTVSLEEEVYLLRASQELLRSLSPDSSLYEWCKRRAQKKMENNERWGLEKALAAKGHILFSDTFSQLPPNERDAQFSRLHFQEVRTRLLEEREAYDKTISSLYEALATQLSPQDQKELKSGWSALAKVIDERERNGIPREFPSATTQKFLDGPKEWLSKKKQEEHPELLACIERVLPTYKTLITYLCAHRARYNFLHLTLKQLPELGLLNELYETLLEVENTENTRLLGHLASLLVALAKENDAAFIYERMGVRYDSIFIDEFQDTSQLHWKLLEPFVKNALSQGGEALLVGDVKQAIYRWRGGDWQLLAKTIPDAYTGRLCSHTLNNNYRSAREIVTFNNQLFSQLLPATKNYTETFLDNVAEDLAPLRAAVQAKLLALQSLLTRAYEDASQGIKSSLSGGVHLSLVPEGEEEVAQSPTEAPVLQYTLRLIDTLIEGGLAPERIAVLVRTRRMAQYFVEAIASHQNGGGTQYAVVSQDGLLLDASHDVQLALAALRIAVGREEDLDIITVAQFVHAHLASDEPWTRQLFDKEAHESQLSPHLCETLTWLRSLATLPLLDLFDGILQGLGLPSHSGEMPYIATLRDKVYAYQQREQNNAHAFLTFYDTQDPQKRHVSSSNTAGALNLLTIHKAKGLEFDTVICPELDYHLLLNNDDTVLWDAGGGQRFGTLPHGVSLQHLASEFAPNTVEEYFLRTVDALNTYYVAFTRAKRQLYLVHSYSRAGEEKETKGVKKSSFSHNFCTTLLPVLEAFPWEKRDTTHEVRQYSIGDINGLPNDVATSCEATPAPKGSEPNSEPSAPIPPLDSRGEGGDSALASTALPCSYPYLQRTPMAGHMVISTPENDLETLLARSEASSLGTKLHRLMTTVNTISDLPNLGAQLVREHLVDSCQAHSITSALAEAMQSPLLGSCYCQDPGISINAWTEHDFLGADGMLLRPDRIVFLATQTVVIDFKFGNKRSSHRKQIAHYTELLSTLGYPAPLGILWYIHVNGAPCEVECVAQ